MTAPSMTRQQAQKILGVPSGAAPDAVKAAYRRLVMAYHPDKTAHRGLGEEETRELNTKISAINVAYEVLNDPQKHSADPTDQLWQAISEIQGTYVQTVMAAMGALPRGIAAVQASSMAMAAVMCPWLAFNPFFTATQNILARFAAASTLDAPHAEVDPQEAKHSGRCFPAPAKHTGTRS